jgi:hypothetical protein
MSRLDSPQICKVPMPKITFDTVQMKEDKSWYVRAALPDGLSAQIHSFGKRTEAVAWIERESADWLKRTETANTPPKSYSRRRRWQAAGWPWWRGSGS